MSKRKRRKDVLKYMAGQMGMEYSADDQWGLLGYLKEFKLFKRGGKKRIKNVLRAQTPELELNVFDYSYVISTGNSSRRVSQTVLFIKSQELGLPDFYMRPEHIFHKLGQWLKWTRDIDFEDFPEFSKKYYLKGPHESFIRYTFNEDVLEFFTDEKGWSMEGLNYFLIFYLQGKIIRVNHLKSFMRKGFDLFEFLREEEE